MITEKIILISDDENKILQIKSLLETHTSIAVGHYNETEAFLQQNQDFDIVIYDLDEAKLDSLNNFIKINVNHPDLRIFVLVSEGLYKALNLADEQEVFWCLDCHHYTDLKDKLEQFRTNYFSVATRMRLLHTVFRNSPIGFAVVPYNKNKSYINDEFLDIVGYTREELLKIGYRSLTHPDDACKEEEFEEMVKSGELKHFNLEKRIIRKDGDVTWVNQFTTIINGDNGQPVRLVVIRSVENRKELELLLEESHRSRATLLQNLPGLAYRCKNDDFWTMEFVSDGAKDLTGYLPTELVSNDSVAFNDIILRKYRTKLRESWEHVIESKGVFEEEYEIKTKEGKIKWVYERGVPLFDQNNYVVALEGIIIDISKSKELEEKLQYLNDYNQKLQLPNRKLLLGEINQRLKAKRTIGTIILVNLKDTQNLYRLHGYEYVELLTASLVKKLKVLESDARKLYLVEEDIYAYLIKGKLNENQIQAFYQQIINEISRTVMREQIRCGIGVTYIKKRTPSPENVIYRARIASEYNREENNLISLSVYNVEMRKKIQRDEHLKQELIDICYSPENTKLRLVFQPIFELKTHRITGFEGLARFVSDIYGPISPNEFIPIVEKNRLIVAFGRKIVDLALDFIKKLTILGYKDFPVSINVSPLQLLDDTFTKDLITRVAEAKVNPDQVMVEVTESIFSTKFEQLNKALYELINNGFYTAIDDFGTGFSTLSRIEKLKFDTVKIDRSFIDSLTHDTLCSSTIPEVISICKKLKLTSLAEGIETKVQYDMLLELGCEKGQGFYMSRPLEVEDAISFILHQQFTL